MAFFRIALAASLALSIFSSGALAQQQAAPQKPDQKGIAADIAAHRALAQVHENAAKCLESGKSEKECHDQLAKECKGVGIGKHCGMRHRH